MTIASALADLNTDIQNARTAITNKGGTITVDGGSSQLATDIGTITELKGETKTINPSTTTQTITPSAGKNGITSATVNPVTSAIDANIQAGNIKKDVQILGVTGTFEGGVTPTGEIEIKNNLTTVDVTNYATAKINTPLSKYRWFSSSIIIPSEFQLSSDTFSGITNINGCCFAHVCQKEASGSPTSWKGTLNFPDLTNVDAFGFYYAFYNNTNSITAINFPNLQRVSDNAFSYTFYGTNVAGNISFPELTFCGTSSFYQAFYGSKITGFSLPKYVTANYSDTFHGVARGCTSLTSVDLNKLETMSGPSVFYQAFYGDTNLTSVNLSSLRSVTSQQAFYEGFRGCTKLTTLNLSKLATLEGIQPMYGLCRGNSQFDSIRLPELKSMTNGRSYFAYAFNGCKSSFDTLSLPELETISISGTTASYAAFYYCSNIKKYYLPKLLTINATVLFNNTSVTELHFGIANQSAVTASAGYSTLWGRGAGAATVYFDLVNTITVGGVAYTRDGTFYDYTNGYYSWTDSSNNTIYTNKEYGQVVGDSVYTKTGSTYSASGTISAIA